MDFCVLQFKNLIELRITLELLDVKKSTHCLNHSFPGDMTI